MREGLPAVGICFRAGRDHGGREREGFVGDNQARIGFVSAEVALSREREGVVAVEPLETVEARAAANVRDLIEGTRR
jgi:hypothetical protein